METELSIVLATVRSCSRQVHIKKSPGCKLEGGIFTKSRTWDRNHISTSRYAELGKEGDRIMEKVTFLRKKRILGEWPCPVGLFALAPGGEIYTDQAFGMKNPLFKR